MAFKYDPGMPWFWLNGELHPFELREEGYALPDWARGNEDTRIADKDGADAPLIREKTVAMLGFDPDLKRVNPDGSVSIMNPQTGRYERAVAAGESGALMPISMAQAQGLQIHNYAMEPKDTGTMGQIMDIAKPLAFIGTAAAGGNLIGNGLNMLPGFGGDGFSFSQFGGADPTSVASSAFESGGSGAMAGAADPFEALHMAMNATGTETAGAAANALGFATPEAMFASVNPAWLTAGAAGAGAAAAGAAGGFAMPPAPAVAGAGAAGAGLLGTSITAADALKYGLPLAGAAMGAMGANGSPAGTTTTTQDIPEWQKPYVTGLLNSAQQTFQSQQNSPQAGLLANSGASQMQSTINGDYLSPDSNPWLKQTYDKAARGLTDTYNYTTMPQLSRAFGNQQAFGGSSAYGEAFGKANEGLATGLADLGTGIYGGNYQSERGRQFTAGAGAPDYAASMQSQPYAGLQAYGNIVGKGFGSQTQQPHYSNSTGGAMSGLLGGYALSNLFGK